MAGTVDQVEDEVGAWIKEHRKLWLDGRLPQTVVVSKELYAKLLAKVKAQDENLGASFQPGAIMFRGHPIVQE